MLRNLHLTMVDVQGYFKHTVNRMFIVLFIALFGCVYSALSMFISSCPSNIILAADHGTMRVRLHENHTSALVRWNQAASVDDVYKPLLVCSEKTTAIAGTLCYHVSDGHHVLNWTWTTSQNLFPIIIASAVINDDGDGDSCAAFVNYISEILITNNHSMNAVNEPIRWACAFNYSSLMSADVLLVCSDGTVKQLLMNYTPPDATMRPFKYGVTMATSQQLPMSCTCQVNVHPSTNVIGFANNSLSAASSDLEVLKYSLLEDPKIRLLWLLLLVPVLIVIIAIKVWWVQVKAKIMVYFPCKKKNQPQETTCTPPSCIPSAQGLSEVTSVGVQISVRSADDGARQAVSVTSSDETCVVSLDENNGTVAYSHAEPAAKPIAFLQCDYIQNIPKSEGVGHSVDLQHNANSVGNDKQDIPTAEHELSDGDVESWIVTGGLPDSIDESSQFLPKPSINESLHLQKQKDAQHNPGVKAPCQIVK